LLQQNQGVPDIVGIGVRMGGENFANAGGQTPRPASGFGGSGDGSALFHASSGSLSNFSRLVTGISKQGIDFFARLHPP
jgi:hypothetical protein